MSDPSTDELRLRATEAQMRRALGLGDQPSSAPEPRSPPITTGTAPAHRRHFVRDGEVPVSVVHHDDGAGTNKLDAARQSLREQIAAREQTERLLEEARATIQALETQLAHERIARDEVVRRVEDERRAIERQLAEERAARQQAERERDDAIADRQKAEERLRVVIAAQEAQKPFTAVQRLEADMTGAMDADEMATAIVPATNSAVKTATVKQARWRGRQPKGLRHGIGVR